MVDMSLFPPIYRPDLEQNPSKWAKVELANLHAARESAIVAAINGERRTTLGRAAARKHIAQTRNAPPVRNGPRL